MAFQFPFLDKEAVRMEFVDQWDATMACLVDSGEEIVATSQNRNSIERDL